MKYSKQLSTHSRVIRDLLTKYRDTFAAFGELINNSIQAKATHININIEYTHSSAYKAPLKRIELIDNGIGVCASEFEEKIFIIGTEAKMDGQGIGRFGALQLGEKITIETVAYDDKEKSFTKVTFPLDTSTISSTLSKVNLEYDVETITKKANPYYKVGIDNIHHNKQAKVALKNRISDKFNEDNIRQAIFEKYPLDIFNRKVHFTINNYQLNPSDFVIDTPTLKQLTYIDIKGSEHLFDFHFYHIKSQLNKVKIFFYIDNGGLKSVAHEFTYTSDWYTPDLGTWFIYLDSKFFNTDLFRNIDMDSIGDEEIKQLKEFIKDSINDFFKANNKRFEKFLTELEKDPSYPTSFESAISKSRELLFQKIAYIVEDEYKLLDQKHGKIRSLFYILIDKALANGYVEEVFTKIIQLNDESMQKFHQLLEKTDLENVVSFSSSVANKLEFLEFLHEITYGDISKVLKERSQLHKIIEKELWLFGEAYNGNPHLWSDKKIGNILKELRDKYFDYSPSIADGNLIELPLVEGLDNITDLFILNEKVLDNEDREIMIVELKSPKCAIGKKELQQIDDYAYTVATDSSLPKENMKFKLVLISSRLTDYTRSKMNSKRELYGVPFLYDKKTEKNIEIYVIEWSELMETNKRKLGYLSSKLKIKDISVKEKFESEYPSIINEKVSARLTKTKADKK